MDLGVIFDPILFVILFLAVCVWLLASKSHEAGSGLAIGRLAKVHLFYIFSFFIIIFITLTSINFYDYPELADLIIFSLSVSSLLLAVIALGYSIYSDRNTQENISLMRKSSKEIEAGAVQMNQISDRIEEKLEKVLSDSLLPIQTEMKSLSIRFNQQKDLNIKFSEETDEYVSEFAEKVASRVIATSSNAGLINLHVAREFYKSGDMIDLDDVFDDNDCESKYVQGYLLGLDSIGVIELQSEKEQEGLTYTVKKFLFPDDLDFLGELERRISIDEDEGYKDYVNSRLSSIMNKIMEEKD